MALPPLADILALFPDNTNGDISAADQRQMITDLYNQIALNDTDNNNRVLVAGDTMTGPLTVDDNISITTANFLNFVAGQAVLASINVDIASNMTIRAVNNLTMDQQRLFMEQFDNPANLNKVLSVTTNGEIVAVEDFAREILAGLTVVSTTLPPGSTATASYDNATNTLTLGIPQGAQGEKGDDGTPGSGGFDPTSNQTITGQWAFDLGTMRTFRVFDDEGVDRININASTNQTLITNSVDCRLALDAVANSRPHVRVANDNDASIAGRRILNDATQLINNLTLGFIIDSGHATISALESALTAQNLVPSAGWLAGVGTSVVIYTGSQWTPIFPSHDAANRQILRRMFESVADRDAYFGMQANFTELLNGDLIAVVNTDTNAVNFQTYQGADNPTVYLPNLWLNRSVSVPAGSIVMEGARISLGGNALVVTNNSQNRTYLVQGKEFNASGTVETDNVPILGAREQEANSQLVDTDTFTGQTLEFTLPALSDFLVSDFVLRFASNVSDITLTIYAGTDDTGPEIVSTRFDAVPGDNALVHDSNPRFVANADYFIRYETTSAQLDILGDNSGATFMPYFISNVWPYSEATAITSRNIDSFVPTRADSDAIHDNVASEINGVAEKTAPVSADLLLIEDSEDSFNKKKLQVGNLPGGTGGATTAANVSVDSANFTGVLVSSGNVQTALERLDATGIAAPIFRFTGSYSAQNSNITEWFDNRAQTRVEGIGSGSGSGNGVFTFDLPGSLVLGTVFDTLASMNLPEVYTLVVDYTGGTSDVFTQNRLVIRPRTSPAPQIIAQATLNLRRGQTATFRITRNNGVISDYTLISLGVVSTAGGSLRDFEFINPTLFTWDASENGTLPGGANVATGFAFLVVNAPQDGSGRFGEVMQDGDWVVWTGDTFTSWDAQPHQWIVVASHDVRRITQLEDTFLQQVSITPFSDRNDVIRGSNYADAANEIRFKIYTNRDDYDPTDLNTTGDIDEYTETTDQTGYLAIRLPGIHSANENLLQTLWVYSERAGVFTRVLNMQRDFSFQGDFTTESDYLSDGTINYVANDVLRLYPTTTIDRYTNLQLDIFRRNLSDELDQRIYGTHPTNTFDEERLRALESKMDALFPLTPDVNKLVEWADIIGPARTTQTVQISTGYSLIADYRGDATRYESAGVTYSDAGTNVVTYTGLGNNLYRTFGFKVNGPADQVLLWIVDGTTRIPYFDMTAAGNYRINHYTTETTQGDPVTDQVHFLTRTGDTILGINSGTSTYTVTPFPAGATSERRTGTADVDILVNGTDTLAGGGIEYDIPNDNTAQAQQTVTHDVNLGPLHGNRRVRVEIGYTFRVSGSDLLLDFQLLEAPSDVTVRMDSVATLLSYTPGATTTRTDDFVVVTDEGGDYTFTGENEVLLTFHPFPSLNLLNAVTVAIDSTGTIDQLNDINTPIPGHNFESVEIPDQTALAGFEFRTFSPEHYLRHNDLSALLPRRTTQWCYGLAELLEVMELSITSLVDFTQGIVLVAPNGTRYTTTVDNAGTLDTGATP